MPSPSPLSLSLSLLVLGKRPERPLPSSVALSAPASLTRLLSFILSSFFFPTMPNSSFPISHTSFLLQ